MTRALGRGMTAPRQVLPGTTYLVTRRCSDRRFFLKPSTRTNTLFLYLLAVASKKYEIEIHAACVLSNHYHLVVTDLHARLPAFGQYLDSLLARALNAVYQSYEHFWSPSSYSAVSLVTPDAIVDKVAYTLANPVAGGLVRHAREWPGVWTSPDLVGTSFEVERPDLFFRKRGKMPKTALLELTVPAPFRSKRDFQAALKTAFGALEREAIEKNKSFMGVKKVLSQRRDGRPSSPREPHGGLRPRVATRDKWKRIEALDRLRSFLEAYRDAREKLLRGVRRVVFPAGTYWLRVTQNVSCAPG